MTNPLRNGPSPTAATFRSEKTLLYDGWGRREKRWKCGRRRPCGEKKWHFCYVNSVWIQERRRVTNRYCVKHAEQLLQLLEEIQPTSITTCKTTIKTYMNNSKLVLAIINCIVNYMQMSIFVYLSQVISSSRYLTVLSHITDFPHIVQA